MQTPILDQIVERVRHLPPEKLESVLDFVRYLGEQQPYSDAREMLLASEHLLAREWDTPEEDEAWRDL